MLHTPGQGLNRKGKDIQSMKFSRDGGLVLTSKDGKNEQVK